MKRQIMISAHGGEARGPILAQIEGEYAIASARTGMTLGDAGMGYAVFRCGPSAWQPIVSGLDRDVAVAVAMDLNKFSQNTGRVAQRDDLLAVLRTYLGIFF